MKNLYDIEGGPDKETLQGKETDEELSNGKGEDEE